MEALTNSKNAPQYHSRRLLKCVGQAHVVEAFPCILICVADAGAARKNPWHISTSAHAILCHGQEYFAPRTIINTSFGAYYLLAEELRLPAIYIAEASSRPEHL